MDNQRPEKMAIVDEVKGRLEAAEAVMVTEDRGLSVDELSKLRISLRPAGGSYKVYKNTLVRRAAEGLDDEFSELLVGPTALAFTETTPEGETGDVVSVAKALKDFAADNPNLIVKGGLFEGQFIDADGLKQLADIEPREVLLAKLAGMIAAPMTQMAGLLQALPRDMAHGLKAVASRSEVDQMPVGAQIALLEMGARGPEIQQHSGTSNAWSSAQTKEMLDLVAYLKSYLLPGGLARLGHKPADMFAGRSLLDVIADGQTIEAMESYRSLFELQKPAVLYPPEEVFIATQ